jgi:hypothetical protein
MSFKITGTLQVSIITAGLMFSKKLILIEFKRLLRDFNYL